MDDNCNQGKDTSIFHYGQVLYNVLMKGVCFAGVCKSLLCLYGHQML